MSEMTLQNYRFSNGERVNILSSLLFTYRFAQKVLNIGFCTEKNIRCDTNGCAQAAVNSLMINETDKSVVMGCKIARECEELLIRERLEIVIGSLK